MTTPPASCAFVIGQITVKDAALWARYREQVPATLAPWGAELLVRGHRVATLSGASPHTESVVIRFPDAAALRGWHDSPAYQALIPLREQAAELLLVGYEGA